MCTISLSCSDSAKIVTCLHLTSQSREMQLLIRLSLTRAIVTQMMSQRLKIEMFPTEVVQLLLTALRPLHNCKVSATRLSSNVSKLSMRRN